MGKENPHQIHLRLPSYKRIKHHFDSHNVCCTSCETLRRSRAEQRGEHSPCSHWAGPCLRRKQTTGTSLLAKSIIEIRSCIVISSFSLAQKLALLCSPRSYLVFSADDLSPSFVTGHSTYQWRSFHWHAGNPCHFVSFGRQLSLQLAGLSHGSFPSPARRRDRTCTWFPPCWTFHQTRPSACP